MAKIALIHMCLCKKWLIYTEEPYKEMDFEKSLF